MKIDELFLIALFCHIDDFYKALEAKCDRNLTKNDAQSPHWWATRESRLCESELITLATLQGIQLITKLKARMKNRIMDTVDKALFFKQGVVTSSITNSDLSVKLNIIDIVQCLIL